MEVKRDVFKRKRDGNVKSRKIDDLNDIRSVVNTSKKRRGVN